MPQRHIHTFYCLFFFAIGALVGCTKPSEVPLALDQVEIAPGLPYTLPRLADFGPPFQVTQHIDATHGQDRFSLDAYVEYTDGQMTIIGVNAFGAKLFKIRWAGTSILYEVSRDIPDQFVVANLLADFSLIYWPPNAVHDNLTTAQVAILNSPFERTIRQFGHDVIVISHLSGEPNLWARKIRYRNLSFDYQIDIQSAILSK